MTLEDVSKTESAKSPTEEQKGPEDRPKPKPRKSNAKKEWVQALRVAAKSFIGKSEQWLSKDLLPDVSYDVIFDERGERRLVQMDIENRTITPVVEAGARFEINKHVEEVLTLVKRDFAAAAAADIKHIYQFIVDMAPGIDQNQVHAIATKSQPGIAYRRVPFDLDSTAPCPTWDSIVTRCSNAEALQAFFGSLFDPKADRSQFLFLYGGGNDGKGAIIEAMADLFGIAHTNQTTPADNNKHWLATVYSKRLVTFSDIDDMKFMLKEQMKAVTGNDTVSVDEKHVAVFKANAICKFMFSANKQLYVKDTPAHRRRVIYSEIQPWKKYDDKGEELPGQEDIPIQVFVGGLKAEIHAFLSRCWRIYKEMCPNGEKIKVDAKAFDALIEEADSGFEEILDDHFVLEPNLSCRGADIEKLFEVKRLNWRLKGAFTAWLKSSKHISYNNRRIFAVDGGKTSHKAYWGLAPKLGDVAPVVQYQQGRGHEGFKPSEEEREKWEQLIKGLDFPVAALAGGKPAASKPPEPRAGGHSGSL